MSCWTSKRGLRLGVATPGLALCLLVGPTSWASAHDGGESAATSGKASRCGKPRKASKAKSSRAVKGVKTETPAPADKPSKDDTDELSGDDDLGEAEESPKKSEPVSAPSPTRGSSSTASTQEAEPVEDDSGSAAAEDTENDASADASAEDAPAADSAEAEPKEAGPAVAIQPYLGFGISTRQLRVPTDIGLTEVAPSVVPAAEVGLRVVTWPQDNFSLVFNLVYQSAVGFTVTEPSPLALDKQVRARSERVAVDVAPHWRRGSMDFGVAVGGTMRTLWPEVHTSQTPGYSLVGPHVRLELNVGLGSMLYLRVSPEAQFIILIDQSLRDAGVSASGVALGGDMGIDARLSSAWSLGVNYHEAHALLGVSRPDLSFADVERYVTLRGAGSF
jgi:hypothetical protein